MTIGAVRSPTDRRSIALAVLLVGCAHAPEREATRVDSDWIRPRLEEAARAARGCLRDQPERVVEMELSREGRTRGWLYPSPPLPAQQACVDRLAATVPLQPSNDVVRVAVGADSQLLDPDSPRLRSLALRARVIDQVAPVEACRLAWQKRAAGASGRVGLLLTVDGDGASTVESPASTLDAAATACVVGAARGLRLAGLAGSYRFSYLAGPRGLLVGAPDVDPVDATVLAMAIGAQRRNIDGCVATYRTPGRLLVHVRFGNDGVPLNVSIDRETGGGQQDQADVRADACLRQAAAQLRVLPFDGPPATQTIPFTLR